MSTKEAPKPEAAPKAKPRVVPGGSKSDEKRAKELVEKYGLQRLVRNKP